MTTHLPDWLGSHSPLCLGKVSVFCNSFMMLNLTFFVQGYLFVIPSVSWTDLDRTVHSVWVKFQYFPIPSWWFISPFLSRATSSSSHREPNCSLGSRPSWFSGHLQDESDSVLLSVSSLEKEVIMGEEYLFCAIVDSGYINCQKMWVHFIQKPLPLLNTLRSMCLGATHYSLMHLFYSSKMNALSLTQEDIINLHKSKGCTKIHKN